MYDERFWRHERYWKFTGAPFIPAFKGTPFASVISRLLGVRLGRRVFDDGCRFFDKSLIEVGDYANLNEGSTFQGHPRGGAFKSDTIKIGSKCSTGCAAFVHYGVNRATTWCSIRTSFLMKGEIVDADTVWAGIRPGHSWAPSPARWRRNGSNRAMCDRHTAKRPFGAGHAVSPRAFPAQ